MAAKFVLATHNPGKLKEMSAILGKFGIDVMMPADLGITVDVEETGETFAENAMKYGYADGDLGRIKTQQAFLKAVIEQLLQMKNVTKINEFSKIFEENVKTDLSISNLFWFGKSAILGGLTMDNVSFVTMKMWPISVHSFRCWATPLIGTGR